MTDEQVVSWILGEEPSTHEFRIRRAPTDIMSILEQCDLVRMLDRASSGLGQRLVQLIADFMPHEPALMDWLALGAQNTEDFAKDPLAAMQSALPDVPPSMAETARAVFADIAEVLPKRPGIISP